MINRQNYQDTREFIKYMELVMQLDCKSITNIKGYLRHLLEWADQKPFTRAKEIKPSFPVYMLTARNGGEIGKQLSPTTMKKTCEYNRKFFQFAINEWPTRYKRINHSWVDSIRPPRTVGLQTEIKKREYYTFEDVLKISKIKPESVRQKRDIAAVCFLYLSGMRSEAFCSLPIKAIDWNNYKIDQFPSLGVKTKNHKAATTTILKIPEFVEICKDWNNKLKDIPEYGLWYAPMKGDAESIDTKIYNAVNRGKLLRKGLKELCGVANIKYLSPHKLRHGHVMYCMGLAKDLAELKAVSQNVMHSSVGITDSIYGGLMRDQVHDIISGFGQDGQKPPEPKTQDESIAVGFINTILNDPEMLEKLKNKLNQ